ncbi:unnamed protein product [Lasius platythorax]|uniref:Uncharacterized protein n=1 Tax=Lasius platythorax TaxID=488582 RepID=A0AAV2N1H5_9HYME
MATWGKPVPEISSPKGYEDTARALRIATVECIPERDSRQLKMNELSARLYIFAFLYFSFLYTLLWRDNQNSVHSAFLIG